MGLNVQYVKYLEYNWSGRSEFTLLSTIRIKIFCGRNTYLCRLKEEFRKEQIFFSETEGIKNIICLDSIRSYIPKETAPREVDYI